LLRRSNINKDPVFDSEGLCPREGRVDGIYICVIDNKIDLLIGCAAQKQGYRNCQHQRAYIVFHSLVYFIKMVSANDYRLYMSLTHLNPTLFVGLFSSPFPLLPAL